MTKVIEKDQDTIIGTPQTGDVENTGDVKPVNDSSVPSPISGAHELKIAAAQTGVAAIAKIPTVQFTVGSMRSILGRKALNDLEKYKKWNSVEDTLSARLMLKDGESESISLIALGTNLLNPLSLPAITATELAGSVLAEAALYTKYFQGNGPSIATPGSVKRAEVEQKMSAMKSIIVNWFNRSIPFTDIPTASRTAVLQKWEIELGKAQLLIASIDSLRGYATYLTKCGITLDDTWQQLYDPALYTTLAQMYKMIKDLPVFDHSFHKRVEEKTQIYTVSEMEDYPGACHMQDCAIAESLATEGISASTNGPSLTHILPNVSKVDIWAAAANGGLLALVQEFAKKSSQIISQYEMVYTALTQLIGKGAMDRHTLSEYLPMTVNELGVACFSDSEPVWSHAEHERFEYAPFEYEAEVGTANGIYIWTLNTLPAPGQTVSATGLMGRRPVGQGHGDPAWDTVELAEVGLFKMLSSSPYFNADLLTTQLDAATGALASPSAVAIKTPFVDAVYGDFFAISSSNYVVNGTPTGGRRKLHGLSLYASGLHNTLSMPFLGVPTTTVGDMTGVFADNGTAYISQFLGDGDNELIRPYNAFITRLCEMFNLHWMIVDTTNPSGERRLPFVVDRGYKNCEFYTFSLMAEDNATAESFGSFTLELRAPKQKSQGSR